MKLARIVFWVAAAWGAVTTTPLFFLLGRFNAENPPAVTHVELYYGFAVTIFVWQLVYFLIGTNPSRFRPMMLAAILVKAGWVVAVALLSAEHTLGKGMLFFAAADAVFAALFIAAFLKTPEPAKG